MDKRYGKMPRPRSAKAAPPSLADGEVLIAIHGRHTIEQLARELQIALARLEDAGAHGVEKFRIRLEPRDACGQPVILRDGAGKPITRMQIPEPAPEPAYRPGPYDAPSPPFTPPAPLPGASFTSSRKR